MENQIHITPQLDVNNDIHVTPQIDSSTIGIATEFDKMVTTDGIQTLTNKTIDALYNTIININISNFANNVIVTYIENESIATNDHIPTEKAVAVALARATEDKLTAKNLIAGQNITLDVDGNNVTINSITDTTGLLKADGSVQMDSNYEPVSPQDIATKSYTDENIKRSTSNKLEASDLLEGANIHIVPGEKNNVTISSDLTTISAGDNVTVEKEGLNYKISSDLTEIEAGDNVHVEQDGLKYTISSDLTTITAGDNVHVEQEGLDYTISSDLTEIEAGENVTVEQDGLKYTINADVSKEDLKDFLTAQNIIAGHNISIDELTGGNIQINSEVDEEKYTNPNGCIAVGGIKAGTTFNDLTMSEMWDLLLYPELYPSLSNPSVSLSRSPSSSYYEIGDTISFSLTASFNRGSINPAYGTSGYRSGLPNKYDFTGAQTEDVETTNMSATENVTDYTVLSGSQSWSCRTYYDAGEQPKSNKGADYGSPLPAGSVTSSVSFTGVYPYFATTANLNTLTKQSLTSMSSTYVQINMVAESDTSDLKQRAEFPQAWRQITGIQFLNTLNNTWEWLDGSKANSLLTFTKTTTTKEVQGNEVAYNLYTNNKTTTGARQLRFYTN